MSRLRSLDERSWRFDAQCTSSGVRIYALSGSQIIAGLDAGYHGSDLAISVIYVLPSWRGTGLAERLQEHFFVWLDISSKREGREP